jgi:phenylacetic acid degradation operon negative regulatory protein
MKTIHFSHARCNFCITSMSERRRGAAAAGARIARWIGRELAVRPPKAKSLVVTVWGDAIAPHGGAVWLSGLIRLLAPLGLNERLVRTSVYRLAREGWLVAQQQGRRSRYRLTEQGQRRFEHAYRRIYAPPAGRWDGRWEIVLAPAAALGAPQRRELRKELWWEGFGHVAPGVFVRPARAGVVDAVGEIVRTLAVERGVSVVAGRDVAGLEVRRLQTLVRDCWNLAALAAEYRRFIHRFDAVAHDLRAARLDPEQCFVVRSILIHAFRRATLHDPQLPSDLLPARWPAAAAYALCRDLYMLAQSQAERYLESTLDTGHGSVPPAAAYFYRRFGGLPHP